MIYVFNAPLPPHLIQLLFLLLPLKVFQDSVRHHLGEVHPHLQRIRIQQGFPCCCAIKLLQNTNKVVTTSLRKVESHLDVFDLAIVVSHLALSEKSCPKLFFVSLNVPLNLLFSATEEQFWLGACYKDLKKALIIIQGTYVQQVHYSVFDDELYKSCTRESFTKYSLGIIGTSLFITASPSSPLHQLV